MNMYVLIAIIAIVGQLILNWVITQYLTKLKLLILTYLAQGPKFYDEIDNYIKEFTGDLVGTNWLFLPVALHQLEVIEVIRKRKEMHPTFKVKKWQYRLNPRKPKKEPVLNLFTFLNPAPGFNCELTRAPN